MIGKTTVEGIDGGLETDGTDGDVAYFLISFITSLKTI